MKTPLLLLMISSSVCLFGQRIQRAALAAHSGLLLEIPSNTSLNQLDLTVKSLSSAETSISFPSAFHNKSGELEKLEVKIQYTCQGTQHQVGGYLEFLPKRNLNLGLIYISPNCDFGVISAPTNALDNLVSMFFGNLTPALRYNSISGALMNTAIVAGY